MKRVGPQAIVPAGLMICGKIEGSWVPDQDVTASLDGAAVVAQAPAPPEADGPTAADGALVAAPVALHAARITSRAAASQNGRRGVIAGRVAEVAFGRRRARMRGESPNPIPSAGCRAGEP